VPDWKDPEVCIRAHCASNFDFNSMEAAFTVEDGLSREQFAELFANRGMGGSKEEILKYLGSKNA
jgi:hypothetical protein